MGALRIFLLSPQEPEGPCPGMALGLHEPAVFCSVPVYGKLYHQPQGGCGDDGHVVCLEDDGRG